MIRNLVPDYVSNYTIYNIKEVHSYANRQRQGFYVKVTKTRTVKGVR